MRDRVRLAGRAEALPPVAVCAVLSPCSMQGVRQVVPVVTKDETSSLRGCEHSVRSQFSSRGETRSRCGATERRNVSSNCVGSHTGRFGRNLSHCQIGSRARARRAGAEVSGPNARSSMHALALCTALLLAACCAATVLDPDICVPDSPAADKTINPITFNSQLSSFAANPARTRAEDAALLKVLHICRVGTSARGPWAVGRWPWAVVLH